MHNRRFPREALRRFSVAIAEVYFLAVMMNTRKLAAIDIVYLGSRFTVIEYASGVFLGVATGLFTLARAHSKWQVALGVYLIALGINYVPMLVYAIAITRGQDARMETAEELADRRCVMSKYRRQSMFLLVPLLPPIFALAQERRDSAFGRGAP